jgi:hypothetical protein
MAMVFNVKPPAFDIFRGISYNERVTFSLEGGFTQQCLNIKATKWKFHGSR